MKKFTNNTLRLAILAALAGGSCAAYAAFPASPAANGLPTSTTIHAVPKVWAATTAFTPSASQPLQITVNLSGNTKFAKAPIAKCSTKTGSATAAQSARLLTLSLGGNGSTQAVFTGTTAASAQLNSCFVSATAFTVTGTHASVVETITFKYGTLASSTTNGNLITWVNGLSAGAVTTKTVTARVTASFMKFAGGATVVTAAHNNWKGKPAVSANTATIGKKSELGTFLSTATITFAGTPLAAAAAGGVFVVATAVACSTASKLAGTSAKAGAASVSFSVTPAQASAGLNGCFTFNGTTTIPTGSITSQLGGTAKTSYSLTAPAASTAVAINHDGTTLSAPLVNVPAGWISRLVLTNRGSTAAAYTVTHVSETGTTVTLTGAAASGTIAASSTSVIDLATLMTAVGNARGSLLISIAGTSANVDGLYQIVNSTTGSISNYTLISK